MSDVTIYTTALCPYCTRAKEVLRKKGISFSEIDVGRSTALRDEMTARAGGRYTVPQIFIGDTHVGGCDDLMALTRAGKLEALIEQAT
jgi:glutaredoxin 3